MTFRLGSTASRLASASDRVLTTSDIVFAADSGVAAGFAAVDVVGRRRKLPSIDGIERIRCALDGLGQDLIALRGGRKQGYDTPGALEREIDRLPELPASSSMVLEHRCGAKAVEGKLQRPSAVRRPPKLVVDD